MTSLSSRRSPIRRTTTSAAPERSVRTSAGSLPVFVLDHYDGYRVKLVQDCTRAELDAWVEANASVAARAAAR